MKKEISRRGVRNPFGGVADGHPLEHFSQIRSNLEKSEDIEVLEPNIILGKTRTGYKEFSLVARIKGKRQGLVRYILRSARELKEKREALYELFELSAEEEDFEVLEQKMLTYLPKIPENYEIDISEIPSIDETITNATHIVNVGSHG